LQRGERQGEVVDKRLDFKMEVGYG